MQSGSPLFLLGYAKNENKMTFSFDRRLGKEPPAAGWMQKWPRGKERKKKNGERWNNNYSDRQRRCTNGDGEEGNRGAAALSTKFEFVTPPSLPTDCMQTRRCTIVYAKTRYLQKKRDMGKGNPTARYLRTTGIGRLSSFSQHIHQKGGLSNNIHSFSTRPHLAQKFSFFPFPPASLLIKDRKADNIDARRRERERGKGGWAGTLSFFSWTLGVVLGDVYRRRRRRRLNGSGGRKKGQMGSGDSHQEISGFGRRRR